MRAQRAKRNVAVAAVGFLLAGGAAIGTAGTASAAGPTMTATQISHASCKWHEGYWEKKWYDGWYDKNHKWHEGYWKKTWHEGYWKC